MKVVGFELPGNRVRLSKRVESAPVRRLSNDGGRSRISTILVEKILVARVAQRIRNFSRKTLTTEQCTLTTELCVRCGMYSRNTHLHRSTRLVITTPCRAVPTTPTVHARTARGSLRLFRRYALTGVLCALSSHRSSTKRHSISECKALDQELWIDVIPRRSLSWHHHSLSTRSRPNRRLLPARDRAKR